MVALNMEVYMSIVNLKQIFGSRYRVTFEESYYAERGEHGRTEDPWLMIIPAQHGHFFPHGEETLAFSSNQNGRIANRLRRLDFAAVRQDGDDGVTVVFPAGRFEAVAEIAKPKRRRRLSEQHKSRLLEAGRAHRFRSGDGPQKSPPEAEGSCQPLSSESKANLDCQNLPEGIQIVP
jgi:hypothetical protein